MTKIHPEDEKMLEDLAKARKELSDFKAFFEMKKRAEYDGATAEREAHINEIVHRAFKRGVPKRRIGEAYGTKDSKTINLILATDPRSGIPSNPPTARMDGDTLVLTFNGTPGITEEPLTGEYVFTRDGRFWEPVELGPITTKITKLMDSDESNPVKDAVDRATRGTEMGGHVL